MIGNREILLGTCCYRQHGRSNSELLVIRNDGCRQLGITRIADGNGLLSIGNDLAKEHLGEVDTHNGSRVRLRVGSATTFAFTAFTAFSLRIGHVVDSGIVQRNGQLGSLRQRESVLAPLGSRRGTQRARRKQLLTQTLTGIFIDDNLTGLILVVCTGIKLESAFHSRGHQIIVSVRVRPAEDTLATSGTVISILEVTHHEPTVGQSSVEIGCFCFTISSHAASEEGSHGYQNICQ